MPRSSAFSMVALWMAWIALTWVWPAASRAAIACSKAR